MSRRPVSSNRALHPTGRGLIAAGLVLFAGVLAAACSSSPGEGGRRAVTLTLYNGQHVQTTDSLVRAFEATTGIAVAVRSDDEDALADVIATEGPRSPADVIYTENSPALEFLQAQGLLAPLPGAILSRTPTRFDSPRGRWVGVSARVSVLVYDPRLIPADRLPTSVLALASPRYRGMLALAPGETDFQPIVTAVERRYGASTALRWLEGLKANVAGHLYPDNETVTSAVNRGQAALGLIDQYYWYRLGAEIGTNELTSRIATFAPGDPGYVVDVSGAAVLSSSKHRREAEALLAFLVSHHGQEIIAHSDSFEYPIASGVSTAAHETPFAALRPDPISIAELGDGRSAVALLQQAGLL